MLSIDAITSEQKLVRTCSIWRALNDVGDVPSLLILQSIWMQKGRFSEINKFTCLPKAVLSNRLQNLRDAGILDKPSSETSSGTGAYRLTAKGLDLFWVVLMLLRWESTWSEVGRSVKVELIHTPCGHAATPVPSCAHCGDAFSTETVHWTPGPGIGLVRPSYSRRRQSKVKLHDKDITLLFTESAEVLGDRWSVLILRAMMTGLSQFDQILDDTTMATNMLSARLKWLQEIGLVHPHEGHSGAYRLTEKGADFFPILAMLQAWGDRHYRTPEGPPVIFQHATCSHELLPVVTCNVCGEIMKLGETSISLKW